MLALSFKHTVQLWLIWTRSGSSIDCDDKLAKLFVLIAHQKVGNCPGHIEPRALNHGQNLILYSLRPRYIATDIIRKQGHAKKLK